MLNNRSPPAGAYWEYLVAYQLVADAIPNHRDYYDRIEASRSQMHRDFVQLTKVCAASLKGRVHVLIASRTLGRTKRGSYASKTSLSMIIREMVLDNKLPRCQLVQTL